MKRDIPVSHLHACTNFLSNRGCVLVLALLVIGLFFMRTPIRHQLVSFASKYKITSLNESDSRDPPKIKNEQTKLDSTPVMPIETVSLSLAYDPSCEPCKVADERFHIISNFFNPVHPKWRQRSTVPNNLTAAQNRLDELIKVLNLKLADDRVAAVHLLYNHPFTLHFMHTSTEIKNKSKLVLHRVDRDPSYSDALQYTNDYLLNRAVIFLNQDIFLGPGFEMVNRTILCDNRVTYALTRYGGNKEKYCTMPPVGCGMTGYIGSHDTYVYCLRKPLPLRNFAELNAKSDEFGVENIWIWAFRQEKFKVLNPCLVLKTYHVHCNGFHSKKRTRINSRHSGAAGYTNKLY